MTAHCLFSGLCDGNKEETTTSTKHTHIYILPLPAFSVRILTNANVVNMPESGLFVFQNSALRVDGGGHCVLCAVCVCDVAGRQSPMITCHNKPLLRSYIFCVTTATLKPQRHVCISSLGVNIIKVLPEIERQPLQMRVCKGLVDIHIHKKPADSG